MNIKFLSWSVRVIQFIRLFCIFLIHIVIFKIELD